VASGEAVRVRGLVKSYGDVHAVAGIDFDIASGEVFALLGPNGAGKTTTVEILEGYRRRDSGEVTVLGLDPGRDRGRLKARIGIVLQSTGVDRYLTVAETIAMYARCYPHPRPVDEVIDVVGLAGKRDSHVVRLSGGQQRRLDVAIVAGGRIVAAGDPATLGGRDTARAIVRYRVPAGVQPPADLGVAAADGAVEFVPDDIARALHRLSGWAIENDVSLDELQIVRPSLEDIYLQLTDGS